MLKKIGASGDRNAGKSTNAVLAARGRLDAAVSHAYTQWREGVYRYLVSLGLTPPQAQEAAQDVFVKLYMTLRRGDEPIRNHRAWIFRAAHNLAVNVRSRQPGTVPLAAALEATTAETGWTPERTLIERERVRTIRLAMSTLSTQQLRCLRLRAEGRKYADIAKTVGVSVSTVGEFLGRAVMRLRKALLPGGMKGRR